MKGISTVTYQGKIIYFANFINSGKTKEDTLGLINDIEVEFAKKPLKSILALIDVSNIFFHLETLKAFKNLQNKSNQYCKKVAIIGLRGLMKTGFNSVAGKNDSVKSFNSEIEAKEWLISD